MPKETLIIKEFTTGLVGSDHGSDLPENVIVEGGNINVNRNLGLIELAGRYQDAKRADDDQLDGTAESWTTPGNFLGFRGRGLFYFLSDYGGMFPASSNDAVQWESQFTSHFSGAGVYIGPTGSEVPTEYYLYASRHANRTGFDNAPGYTASVFHVYSHAKTPVTKINMFGENLGYVNDGIYNGHIIDFFMGDYAGGNYNSDADPTYAENFIPVFYWANGGLRICDGGFLSQNKAKIYLGYEKDGKLFGGLTTDKDNTDLTATINNNFRVDNWVLDKGGNTDDTE